jgi:predicted nuclease with TOPRIM domain|nr:MAG TPA: chromosome segregation ATPase [Caudoviricetes sp.]
MSCKPDCGYPIKPAPFAPADPGCGPCGPHHPPMPPRPPVPCGPCPPSQYVGSRYVPIFADPIEWDNHRSYESLTIVTHDGESYTSKCNVGPGIDITNERYWAKTGAYNAQVAQYRAEVKDLSAQVSGFASDNAEFREKIDQFTKDNAEMKNTVAANNARVDALAERMATAETEIDGLQATTAQHTTDLANLHAKDEDLQRQITSNDNDIAALQAKDTEQDSRLNGIDTKLKSHDASIAQNTADIAKNTKNIQDNAANIAKNAHELADHAAKLADHEGRLTAQHEEITANHQAIEHLTSVTDGLRSDLTEDEAKIEANRDAIAHIQEKDVQQDGRLDKLEECCEQAKAHFTQLDTKTDDTNAALTAEIDRAKAAELANGRLIAKNAAELATHATELADHEKRITALEGDNATNKQEIADLKAKNTAQDTAISGNTDAIQHLTENLTGYVKTETYTAGQAAQDTRITDLENDKADKTALGDYVTKTDFNADQKRQDNIVGDWETDHPGQTVSQCVTSQETELAEHAASIAKLETDKADKSEIPDVTGFVTEATYTAGQTAQDTEIAQKQTATPFAAPFHVGAIGIYIRLANGGPAIVFRYSGVADVDPRTTGTPPQIEAIQVFKPDGTPLLESIKSVTSFNYNRDMYVRANFSSKADLPDAQCYYIVVI